MSSSRTSPAGAGTTRHEHLLQVLTAVPDPRDRRGVRHPIATLLALGLAAVIAGARSFVVIGEWVATSDPATLAALGVEGARPDESTIRRAFARLDPVVLDRVIGAYLWTRSQMVDGRRVIALDGKTVRGARSRARAAPHLVSAFDHAAGVVLGQRAIDTKSNEIPCATDLLATFDVHGAVVTMDAMHTQTDTATAITTAGGDYVFTVKGNQPTLHAKLKKLPWKDIPSRSATAAGHGRRVRRTIKVASVPDWVTFPGAAQVAQLRRTVTKAGKTTVEVVYLITSANPETASPATLAAWVQGHWGIENRLHWVRDVVFDEDRSQVRAGHAPHVMATLRNTAISLLRLHGWTSIAQGLRHHARDPERALKLLLTC